MANEARMKDVAAIAGVGVMTVSRVLRGNKKVSSELTIRVRDAAKQLCYHPDPFARALRTKRRDTVGIIVPNLSKAFFGRCAEAAIVSAKQRGFSVVISTYSRETFQTCIATEAGNCGGLDGILLVSEQDRLTSHEAELMSKTALVVCNQETTEGDIDTVVLDRSKAIHLAVDHLIGHGHKRVAFITSCHGSEFLRHDSEFTSYTLAMDRHGIQPLVISGCDSESKACDSLRSAFRKGAPPTAALISHVTDTCSVMDALLRLGIRVPSDLALVGHDDSQDCGSHSLSITSIRHDAAEMGKVSMDLLMQRIAAGESYCSPSKILIPVSVEYRQSCGCP